MPRPSSRTRNSFTPPCSTSISMRVAPASRLFSSNSLITEAGRSTTSPAAIWLARRGLNNCIRDIFLNPMTASGVIFYQHTGGRHLQHLTDANLIAAQPIGLAQAGQADIVTGGDHRQGITRAYPMLLRHLRQLAAALERCKLGTRRRVTVEIASDTRMHGPGQGLLVAARDQLA